MWFGLGFRRLYRSLLGFGTILTYLPVRIVKVLVRLVVLVVSVWMLRAGLVGVRVAVLVQLRVLRVSGARLLLGGRRFREPAEMTLRRSVRCARRL